MDCDGIGGRREEAFPTRPQQVGRSSVEGRLFSPVVGSPRPTTYTMIPTLVAVVSNPWPRERRPLRSPDPPTRE